MKKSQSKSKKRISKEEDSEEEQKPILFYGHLKQYGFLSNFYHSPFHVSGSTYQTNEHFFQSKKFEGTPYEQEVIAAKDPKTAKAMGKKRKMERIEEWAGIKEKVMMTGLRAKFEQHQELKEQLLATGNRELREHTHKDKYWADGGNKNDGKNRLGVLLMKLRNELRKEKSQK